jgi:hypothetical protein
LLTSLVDQRRHLRFDAILAISLPRSCGALNGFRNGLDRGQPIGSNFGLTQLSESQSRL